MSHPPRILLAPVPWACAVQATRGPLAELRSPLPLFPTMTPFRAMKVVVLPAVRSALRPAPLVLVAALAASGCAGKFMEQAPDPAFCDTSRVFAAIDGVVGTGAPIWATQVDMDRMTNHFTFERLETLPLGVFSLQVRDPVTIDPSDYSSICSWLDLLDQRRNGDQTSFFYGVFDYGASDLGGPYAGCAWLSIPTAVGLIDTDRWSGAAYTFAHEIGHNLSLLHAPCGGPANVDPRFPYSGGTIGVWGYRPSTHEVIAQDVPDLMSYCGGGSEWISDYHFEKALAFVNRAWSAHRGPKIAIPEVWDPEQLRRAAGAEPTSVTRLQHQ